MAYYAVTLEFEKISEKKIQEMIDDVAFDIVRERLGVKYEKYP
mgnify:FL=1